MKTIKHGSMTMIEYVGPCNDCNGPNEPYMVTKGTWVEAGLTKPHASGGGFCCLSCIEKRLGRVLEQTDFIDAPINNGIFGFFAKDFVKQRKAFND